ncbi:DUF4149 domain-containing protein [Steroidobacter agaridevorans]|uniref:DUF4149 domain-containing protein n=1 Tax=Steroidobacter agaridevorans TaxID=2695856 RepID=UPI00132860B1|nr:DUF4149 domain-containing protein [Steroidobacter agaridevorans]GFE91850.1 hypothetical protein GCM10011488_68040 [Steroidobacter agaridevorans]
MATLTEETALPAPRGRRLLDFCVTFLVTLWAGSLWTVCGIVAPQLFATLPERRLAGQMAARLFHIETWLGVVIAMLLIALFAARKAFVTSKTILWLILLTAAAPLASELILGPMMNTAREANDMARFGMLHGVSAVLFLIACLSALALVWKARQPDVNRPGE